MSTTSRYRSVRVGYDGVPVYSGTCEELSTDKVGRRQIATRVGFADERPVYASGGCRAFEVSSGRRLAYRLGVADDRPVYGSECCLPHGSSGSSGSGSGSGSGSQSGSGSGSGPDDCCVVVTCCLNPLPRRMTLTMTYDCLLFNASTGLYDCEETGVVRTFTFNYEGPPPTPIWRSANYHTFDSTTGCQRFTLTCGFEPLSGMYFEIVWNNSFASGSYKTFDVDCEVVLYQWDAVVEPVIVADPAGCCTGHTCGITPGPQHVRHITNLTYIVTE